jgi:hypothetical protein
VKNALRDESLHLVFFLTPFHQLQRKSLLEPRIYSKDDDLSAEEL